MLELRSRTTPEWAARVCAEPLALLSDHAHCELRAATSAQGLIHHHTAQGALCDRLAALAIEEMSHFRQVLRLLEDLGGGLRPSPKSPYVEGLLRGARSAREGRDEALLDRLLIAGLIEARSLERFLLLGEYAPQPELRALYGVLGPSERGHAELFPALAMTTFGADRVAGRAPVLERLEAEVLGALDPEPRMHSGA